MNFLDIVKKLTEKNAEVFYVGGTVRDIILGIPPKDIDVEVYNITEENFLNTLKEINVRCDLVGKSFGIYKVRTDDLGLIDFAFPRQEVKTGEKHTDFEIKVNPFLSKEKATLRRDFTMNAMMINVITGELIDLHNGVEDLKNGLIRYVDKHTFIEDGLRIFRATQFASRFDFRITNKTKKLFQLRYVKGISKSRIEEELSKAMLKSKPQNRLKFIDNLPNTILKHIGIIGLSKEQREFISSVRDEDEKKLELMLFTALFLKGNCKSRKQIYKLQKELKQIKTLLYGTYIYDVCFACSKISTKLIPLVLKVYFDREDENWEQRFIYAQENGMRSQEAIQLGLKGEQIGKALKESRIKLFYSSERK